MPLKPAPCLTLLLASMAAVSCTNAPTRDWRPGYPPSLSGAAHRSYQQSGFLAGMWEDTKSVYLAPSTWLYFGGGLALALGLDSAGVEDELAADFDSRDYLPRVTSHALDYLGTGYVLLGGTAAWYGINALADNAEGVEKSQALASTLIVTGVSTLAMKALFRDERPNGIPEGFPSGHSSMSMAAAAALGEQYGWKAGVPAYALAMMVGFQRMDDREHDLDDVIAGWTVGWVIGTTIAREHQAEILGGQLVPILDPSGAGAGIGLLWQF